MIKTDKGQRTKDNEVAVNCPLPTFHCPLRMKTILLVSPYWKESHRWMVSSVKLADLWQRLGYRVVVVCMGIPSAERRTQNDVALCTLHSALAYEDVSPTLRIYRKKDFFLPDPWNYGIAVGFSGLVRSIIEKEKPDTIVINKVLFWSSLSLLALKLRGIKVALITDALVGMTWWPRGFIPRVAAAIYAWTVGWLILMCAERIVFFHPQPAPLLKRLGIFKKSRVIPTGIDPTPYESAKDQVTSNKDGVTISYIGRLESIKGVDDFLAAITPLKQQYPDITIQVVGHYEAGNKLVQQYEREVSFPGLRSDIPAVLAKTDIFVMPSHSEGLSNAIMEAMSASCACVASDVGGNRYLIQNGVSGFLFPAGDREALQAHVRRLIEDPSKRVALGKAARERIEKEFSWTVVGEKYKSLFEE